MYIQYIQYRQYQQDCQNEYGHVCLYIRVLHAFESGHVTYTFTSASAKPKSMSREQTHQSIAPVPVHTSMYLRVPANSPPLRFIQGAGSSRCYTLLTAITEPFFFSSYTTVRIVYYTHIYIKHNAQCTRGRFASFGFTNPASMKCYSMCNGRSIGR